jgi:hypothetical protein
MTDLITLSLSTLTTPIKLSFFQAEITKVEFLNGKLKYFSISTVSEPSDQPTNLNNRCNLSDGKSFFKSSYTILKAFTRFIKVFSSLALGMPSK